MTTRSTRPRKSAKKTEATRPACARRVLEVVPQVMWLLRREIRRGTEEGLSLSQFRVLAFLSRCPGASLSAVAEFTGVADATASVAVERLVGRRLVERKSHPEERRRVMLDLTDEGASLLERVRDKARRAVARKLSHLPEAKLAALSRGLELLEEALGGPLGP